ncbi:bifunctional [glutamate--ammonia ligase]-adenylyl-L-tyrosine phosphorylase/[glutamate--ammonia-ligase] adenylyltransferase [Tundrisphaera sp. TA3]|uniref:bifunctional [glutamate--ammonia ligase]-adenylyl-L-tyrosine phosphorylase/[glutamate--ammonia-ligase] adenylyltransferase n=1 Tax=Tundrisphaera sp. TA3 TaxID=3435775 RepID=UPI003EB7AE46
MPPNFPFATAERFSSLLENPQMAGLWLSGLGVRDAERGLRDLRDLVRRGLPVGLVARMAEQLDEILPRCPDPGMALTNLERFVAAAPDPEAMLRSLATNPRASEIAVQLFSTSQFFTELMIRDPDLLDWLRSGSPRLDLSELIEELWGRLIEAPTAEDRKIALRRFRLRELLRIGYNDIVRDLPLELVTLDLSHLADACVEGAYRLGRRLLDEKHGTPVDRDGRPARFVVLALGKLGGEELNYSSDIDLIFVYDVEGQTAGPRPLSHAEYFARLGGEIVRTLSDHTALGMAYRVDMRLRPEGDQGPLARSLASTLGYYQNTGRTWERQALIKCRPIAGDIDLGDDFLAAITPFVYRRYLGAAEIAEIKAMKRRIEQRTVSAGTSGVEVKTGRGGIRDVEFVVQFLQLLHGGEFPEVRHANTLVALSKLEIVGCLTAEERGIMVDTYRFLRRVEHRLQTMFDRQTHEMPRDREEQRVLAIRIGYPPASVWEDRTGPAQRFLNDYRSKTEQNRAILNHLMHDAFLGGGDEDGVGAMAADPAVDLVLDPIPGPDLIASALGRYPFRDPVTAYHNLMALSREESPFLSRARCRHFLAGIAPRLLQAVGRAPDPDMALTNLEKVSASLGAKAMLWELFNVNPPTLRLYVELCSTSQLLSEILITNPGMIDDLMDSLVVDRSQPASAIRWELAELCRHAEELAPILLGFRNKEWVRIGTRDILRREPIRDVTRELADVAEAVVDQIARAAWRMKVKKYGIPRRQADGRRANWAVIALGKLGGRELNYHSDLDLIFVHEGEGRTDGGPGRESVPIEQFYGDAARRVLRMLTAPPETGRIYAADARLRPYGNAGPLSVPLHMLADYLRDRAQPWERLALTRARVIHARGGFGRAVTRAIREAQVIPTDPDALAREVVAMRRKLEESRGPNDLKRGPGGLADIEFLAQYLQLVHAAEDGPARANVWEALDALTRAGRLAPDDGRDLLEAYEFLRTVEARLRVVHNRAAGDWPENVDDLARLARHLGYDRPDPAEAGASIRADAARLAVRTRSLFARYLGA